MKNEFARWGSIKKWKEITQELVEKLDMSKSSRIENIISKKKKKILFPKIKKRDNKGKDWLYKI